MKLSRIDYIGLNGGDGEHYIEQLPESEQAYMKWVSEGTPFKVTNLEMWNTCWKLAQEALIKEEMIMSMTRKDFQAIASIIRHYKLESPTDSGYTIEFLVKDLSDYFKQANSSFDKERFLRACGFYGEV